MADEEDKESKTEEPTEKKIKDALEKGQTATSREVPLLVSIAAFTTYMVFSGQGLVDDTSHFLRNFFEQAGTIDVKNALDAGDLFNTISTQFLVLLAPICLLLMAGGVVAAVAQNEPRMVLNRIAPKASKLSLIKGWSRVFGKQGMVEFAKSVSKLLFCGGVVFGALYSSPQLLLSGMFQESGAFGDVVANLMENLLVSVCIAMTLISAADYLWSRHSWRENLKMSRKEITDEHKQAEGDPILKARMRSIARDRSRQRMMDAVPTSTLIIANPTHISVALRFDADNDEAPVVVAKGQDLIALKIREIAAENDIPIFVKVELARALNKAVQVDQIIPPEFYAAVAELINTIYKRTPTAGVTG
ncbi:MAG: flagellar type III secretion system protein FlhB [Rhizobiaceae bacterium]